MFFFLSEIRIRVQQVLDTPLQVNPNVYCTLFF